MLVVHVVSEETLALVDVDRVVGALREYVEGLTVPGVECQLLAGSPHAALIKLADQRKASLVVIGASGGENVGDTLFGTTAENVVRYAHGSVLVVRESPAVGSAVIVGTDFSDASEVPLRVAAQEAKKASAEFVLFHSTHVPKSRLDVLGQLGISASESASDLAARRRAAEAKLGSLLAATGAEGRTVVADEPPREALASLAQQAKAALIVVGTHGRTGLKRVALGSVAANVVREAPCSVLLVR